MTISTSADLLAAVAAAQGGETITLAPGTYDFLPTKPPRVFTAPVTIIGADPANPPLFLGAHQLRGWTNLTLDTLALANPDNTNASLETLRFYGGTNIALRNLDVSGAKDANGCHGRGVVADGVAGFELTRSKLHTLARAIFVSRSSNVIVADNDCDELGTDGFDFAAITVAKILRNLFEKFSPPKGAHPDGIQFQCPTGYAGSTDIEIRDNFIMSDPLHRAQGVFLRCEDTTQRHANVTVAGNIAAGTMWNSIAPSDCDNLVCELNTVLSLPGADKIVGRVSYGLSKGVSRGNRAPVFLYAANNTPQGITVDPNNPDSVVKEATQADVDAALTAWLAKFRAPTAAAARVPRDPLVIAAEIAADAAELRAALGGK